MGVEISPGVEMTMNYIVISFRVRFVHLNIAPRLEAGDIKERTPGALARHYSDVLLGRR